MGTKSADLEGESLLYIFPAFRAPLVLGKATHARLHTCDVSHGVMCMESCFKLGHARKLIVSFRSPKKIVFARY